MRNRIRTTGIGKIIMAVCGALVLLLAANPAALAQGGQQDATVQMTIKVLPFAEITLAQTDVSFQAGATGSQTQHANPEPIDIAGTVMTSGNIQLGAEIIKPGAGTGDWQAFALTPSLGPGNHQIPLLRIQVSNATGQIRTFRVTTTGETGDRTATIVRTTGGGDGSPGTATITVAPEN